MSQATHETLTDPSSGDRLLKASQAAERLGVSVRTVWLLRSTGKLEAVKVNAAIRFRASDIARIVRAGTPE